MPKCTINGKELEVKDGTTIIQAMYSNAQKIAHYCWHPGLSVAGVCRLCMVEIEGNPRLQIACNTVITEGMKINNTSEKVKDAAKWGLDFHLINHPLDCPICDQAGECGLQDQYMEFGKYDPEMAESKVKKKKVVQLGPRVVLDSERCILCSRCVRFTDEVTKTCELGIFNRGDRSEVGTHDGKSLDNKYSQNVVDICPVGALTSKDFRFKQRVWYLKDSNTVCNGCSTGCNIKVYFNKEGFFRVRPVFNENVNGYWMCDEGRDIYKFVNRDYRFLRGMKRSGENWEESMPSAVAKEAGAHIKSVVKNGSGSKIGLVLTGQYTVEEYETVISTFVNDFNTKNIYHWINNPETFDSFDGKLLRGDRNPNTKGLLQVLEKYQITAKWSELESKISSGELEALVIAGPENQVWYPNFEKKVVLFSKVKSILWLQSSKSDLLLKLKNNAWIIPMKSFVEKDGTFVNVNGYAQTFKRATTIVSEALSLSEAALLMAGKNLMVKPDNQILVEGERPSDRVTVENRKKNEFVFHRGSL